MLLNITVPSGHAYIRGQIVLLLILILGNQLAKAAQLPACSLDVPVYGPKGERLPFKITAATLEGEKDTDLFTIRQEEYRVLARGDRLYFRPGFIGKRRLTLVLENGKGGKITTHVALMHCQQRASVELGGISALVTGDVRLSKASGRLTGCKLVGDWWIRAMPMFGASWPPAALEGHIGKDGTFVLSVQNGERHLVIIGKDKQPVKVVGVDVIEGRVNEMGVVDLRGSCPK